MKLIGDIRILKILKLYFQKMWWNWTYDFGNFRLKKIGIWERISPEISLNLVAYGVLDFNLAYLDAV